MTDTTKILTEEDLLKSIAVLETKADDVKKEDEVKEEVKATEPLAKTADVVKKEGSEKLLKTLDASEALNELALIQGGHLDASLEAMQKSIDSAAARDHLMIKVMTDMKKSMDAMAEQIAAFGEQPGKPASQRKADDAVTTDDLKKKVGDKAKEPTEADRAKLRKTISVGIERLMKSAQPNEMQRYVSAGVKFEATGELDQGIFQEIQALNSK